MHWFCRQYKCIFIFKGVKHILRVKAYFSYNISLIYYTYTSEINVNNENMFYFLSALSSNNDRRTRERQ